MHITILALGSRGDIQPYAVLGRGVRQAGHQVRFITFENFAGLIAENELEFYPISGDAQALVTNAGANMGALIRSFSSLSESYIRALSSSLLGETDLILNQLPVGLFGFDLAEKYNLPMVLTAVIPLARTSDFPVMGLPKIPIPGYNKASYYLGEQIAWQLFRRLINRWREQTLSLPPLPLLGYFNRLGTSQIPVINGFSSQVVKRPADWGDHIHLTGYWFPEEPSWQPSTELQNFLDKGDPPVFIGFGSMPVKDPRRTTKVILDALQRNGLRGILHAGWAGIGRQEMPDTVFQIDYAPYSWLFPRMAMIIHHGGSGTTSFGLRAGIPSMVISFVFDQHYWGKRIEELGVGPRPIRFAHLSVDNLSEGMQQGVSNITMRHRAAELGQKIRAEQGIANAIQIIETLQRAS